MAVKIYPKYVGNRGCVAVAFLKRPRVPKASAEILNWGHLGATWAIWGAIMGPAGANGRSPNH